jgi:hypothetical protein
MYQGINEYSEILHRNVSSVSRRAPRTHRRRCRCMKEAIEMSDHISLLIAWRDHDKRTPIKYFDYYACDHSALKPTKKYLLNHGYVKVRTCCAIGSNDLNEVISVLQKKVSICTVVCDIVKTGLEGQALP